MMQASQPGLSRHRSSSEVQQLNLRGQVEHSPSAMCLRTPTIRGSAPSIDALPHARSRALLPAEPPASREDNGSRSARRVADGPCDERVGVGGPQPG